MATMLAGLDLAALLCSRVCHDLISPTGAIVNGLEVLEESKDDETRDFALALIKKSAGQATARLQFCRIAFGAAGSAGAEINLGDAEAVARGFIQDEKTKLTWNLPRAMAPKNRVKLLLNLLLVATQAIPRGGALTVDAVAGEVERGFRIVASGMNARVPQPAERLLAGAGGDGIDAHAIQPYYAALLAQDCGLRTAVAAEGDLIVITAQ
jgi:histidine phosphotransferase ChpT